jgi:tetratricopeptide (TPR) repeat protein
VNYRPEYSHAWTNKTYYAQLRLDPLGRESAERMLTALLGDEASLKPLRDLIVQKTDGNPFFMEEIVQGLIEDGALIQNGTTRLARPLDTIKIPETVNAILASRIDRLPTTEKDLLQTLAVIGREFGLGLVRAATNKSDDELAPTLSALQLAEFIYEQPAVNEVEYTFKHALTQEVAYNSLLQERRRRLHERIGSALETLHREHTDDHLAELAHHYSRSSSLPKAIEYLSRVANQATQRSLYSEAIEYANRGLELLGAKPEGDQRARAELPLQSILGVASMATKGFSSNEVERAFARSCDLARKLGDEDQLFGALQGLWGFHYTRGDADAARKVAEESLALATSRNDPGLLKHAHRALGSTLQQVGELAAAREHLEKALALRDVPRALKELMRFGPDSNVLCLTGLSDLLFTLGYPDQALRRAYEAIEIVKPESDPFSFAMAQVFAASLHCLRREPESAEQLCRAAIESCIEHGFPFWLAFANRCLGWALIQHGRLEEGAAMMNALLHETSGAEADQNLFFLLPALAETYGRLGRFDQAFSSLEDWLAVRRKQSIAAMDKGYHRIRGDLLLRAGSLDEAEKSFRKAIELSVGEGAKTEQLRSTASLARMLRDTNRRDEARAMLADIYSWFTEGFDTADLKDSKAILDSLTA